MDNVSRFVAEIMANTRDFERDLKRAQAQATSFPNEIETEVEADISRFRRGLLQAEALSKRFQSNSITKRILGDASNFREAIFGAKKSVIDFDKHYQDAKGRWHDIDSGAFVKEFKVIDSVFTRFKRKFVKPIIGRVEIKRDGLRNFVTEVDRMNDNFQNELMRLAKMISAVGTVLGNMIRGSLVASFSALIPIIAGLTSAVMALGNAIGVTAGNLAGFLGAVGIAFAGAAAYGGLVASVLARYNDEAFEATEASRAFTRALESIKSVWNGIVDQNIDKIFMQMGQAIYAAQFALEGLTPFINQVVDAMTRMTNELKSFVQESPTMLRFFDNMNSKGTAVFENIIRGLGRFGQGLIDMVNAAMPLIDWVAQGFNNLGTQFANWANRMAETNGFHDFIAYVQENMPKIGKIFGDFFLGVINLFAAFGENSSTVLSGLQDMMERFREWSATIKESDGFQQFIDYIQTNGPTVIQLIGNIVTMIVNFATAIAPLAQLVLNVVTAITGWISELFRAHPIVAQIIGVIITLSGVLMMLLPSFEAIRLVLIPFIGLLLKAFNVVGLVKGAISILGSVLAFLGGPISIVIAGITALVAGFILLYQNVEWFRNIVNTVWEFVTTFIMTKINEIISWFNYFREQGNNIFISALLAIVGTIATGLATAFLTFTNWFTNVLVAVSAWGAQLVLNIISALTQFALNIAMKLLEAYNNFTTWVANVLTMIIIFGGNLINSIVTTLVQFATTIATNLSNAYNNFITWISNTLSSIISFGANLVSTIIGAMASFVSNIASGLANAISEFASFISQAISDIVSFGAEMVSEIISAMSEFVSEIISGGANAVSEIATMGSNIVSEIGGFVTEMVSVGADLISGLIEGIKSMAQGAIDAVGGVVNDAISWAENLLGISSPSKVFRKIGEYTSEGLAIGIDRMAGKATGAVSNIARDMTNAFSPDLTTTADIDGQIGNIGHELRNTVDADIQSGIEVARPQVNITVRNEGDIDMIRSTIEEMNAVDESVAFDR